MQIKRSVSNFAGESRNTAFMNVLIIGATSGIGHELWRCYSAAGNRVVVMGRRTEKLDEMALVAPENTVPVGGDIADLDWFGRAFLDAVGQLGSVDIVILCAGVGELNPGLDMKVELDTVDVNVRGWMHCVDVVYGHFKRQGYGHLATVTSVGGLNPTPDAPSYSASKAFQISYTKALQQKSRNSGIIVTEIRPGLIDTRMAKGDGLFWVMSPDRVAARIVRAIDKKRKLAIIDRRWRVVNFLLKHFV